jgi:hypothetical protein
MIESNLVAGAQKLVPGQPLVYGQSITDAASTGTKRARCSPSSPPPSAPAAAQNS